MSQTWRVLRDAALASLPDHDVRWLLEAANGLTPAEQVAALDELPLDRQAETFEVLVARRRAGEPLQYVVGSWGFRTLDLLVDRRVLIPRPETEVVAGLALEALPAGGRLVDLGTGSGAIALSAAAERWPDVEVWGTDASPDALAVARANLAGLGRRATVVRLAEGDWYAALPAELRGGVDVVVSNPPYVATGDALPAEVADWEPSSALLAGPDGLDELRRIIAEAPDWLTPSGTLVVEIGETQAEAVLALAHDAGFAHATVHPDLTGRDRALVARQ